MMKLVRSAGALSLLLSTSPLIAAETPITLSGAIEVEASMVEDYDGVKTNDVVVATAAVGMDVVVNDRVSATLAFLYEEDETDFGLDEGYVTLKMNETTNFTAGRLFVPFGSFESNMVSDPLTLELGETSETALMVDYSHGNMAAALYTFNGDAEESGETNNDAFSFGASVGYATENMTLGASYISNLADSESLQSLEADPTNDLVGVVDSAVAGMGVSFGYTMGSMSVIAEHIAALDNFSNGDLDGLVTSKEQPKATNLEVAYETGSAVVAVAYQTTEDSLFIGLPETATSVAVSFDVMEGAGVGIEYASREDYSVADGGSGETETALTLQLAVEF